MKLEDLNPRVITVTRLPGKGPGKLVVAIDCPCTCSRPLILEPIPGVFEPDVANPPTTKQEWKALLKDYDKGDEPQHRYIPAGGETCGWVGKLKGGKLTKLDDTEPPEGKLGKDVEGTHAKLVLLGVIG